MVEIKSRYTDEVICTGETLLTAVEKNLADLRGAYLRCADLRDAYLRGADISGAYLRGAYLRCADLRDADLRCADLRDADLRGADLRGAYLRCADLRCADLRDADLRGAKVAWQSHDLLSELLRRSAGDDIAKLKVAGLLLVCRDKCWQQFAEIAAHDPLGDWALSTLAEWVQDGDGAPEIVASRCSTQEVKK